MRNQNRFQQAAWALVLAAILSTGCYGKRLASLEVRTARIEEQLAQLERTNRDMSATLATVQKLLDGEIEQARAGRAGNEQRLSEIQQLLNVLATRVDESGEQYRTLKDDLKYQPKPDSTGAVGPSPRAVYDAAYQDLTRGNHGLAIMGFQEVLAKYPQSELADNAQYWIGESYYAQKDYKKALAEFQKTVSSYPKGDKVPAALLKTGLCQTQLGEKKAAKATFQDLVARYPHTEEARLAGSKLGEL